MEEKDSRTGTTKLFSDVLMVGFFTVLGYSTAIGYQVGYNSYFKIPEFFIYVDTVSILLSCAYTLSACIVFFAVIDYLIGIIKDKNQTRLTRSILMFIGLFLLSVGYIIYTFPPNSIQWTVSLGGFLTFGFLEFCLPLITQRGKGNYLEKFNAQTELYRTNQEIGLLTLVSKKFGNHYIFVLITALFFVFIAYTVGLKKARSNETFNLLSISENLIVLQNYKDFLIVSPYDSKTNRLLNKMFLVNIDDLYKNGYFLTASTTGKILPVR